jgi:ubiquinone/menaquinone biosynthesis C-methylase UbiE
MSKAKQKEIFLESEGDNWFFRNKKALDTAPEHMDYLLQEILSIVPAGNNNREVLEIGCGNGKRLKALKQNGFGVTGLDPSKAAIEEAGSNGVNAYVGTADKLPFKDNEFDILVFGFCLYLCDREDLFMIAAEANRVLKNDGYIFIRDFYTKNEYANDYHHLEGIKSYKMNYSRLFEWHPNYFLIKQEVGTHNGFEQTTDKNEWVAISVLRKI